MKRGLLLLRGAGMLACCVSFNVMVQGQTKSATTANPLPLDTAVRTGKLPNGFTYYIRHNEEPKNRVIFYLVNKAGSILETDDQQGLAHFMEHMSFNGTTHFPKNELIDYLQKSGVRFGADINAYTSFDETVYQLPLPSDNPDILKNGVQIMRDWASEATLDPKEIDKERGVILEEKRLGKGAKERMQRQSMPLMLNQSRYASRIPIGKEEILNTFKPEALQQFYHDWYRPDLQALVVVGDIDVAAMEQTIKTKFGDLKNPVNEKPRTKYKVPLTGKNQFMAITDKEMSGTVAEVIIKHEGSEAKTTADYRASLVRGLFDQMLGGRYSELMRNNPPFSQGSAGVSDFMGGLFSYNVTVVAKPGELEQGFKAVWRENERAKRFGFTQTELDRSRQSYLNSITSSLKEKDKIPSESYVKEYQENFLTGAAAPGLETEAKLVRQLLPEITLEEVNGVMKTYFTANNRDIVLMAPEKEKATLPSEATILAWMKSVEAEKLEPFKDEVSTKAFLAKAPVPGTIISEEHDAKFNTTTLHLSNGLKVILKPTAFKNNEIIFNGFAEGGTSLYDDKDFESAANAVGLINAGGAGNYNVTELGKFLSGKQVGVKLSVGERMEGVNGGSTPEDLETALQLLYAYFTEPRKDEEMFKSIISRTKAGMANRSDDPGSVFSDTLSAVLGNHNIRRAGPSLERIDKINLDRAYSIYKERFADAGNFTFVFVGSIDTATIKPLLAKYLGGLPATGAKEKAKDLGIHIPAGKIEKTVYKGTEQKATVNLVFSGTFDYSQENLFKMQALKEVLEIRMLERLREDESGVYTPSVNMNAARFPESRFSFFVSFGCAPQNVDKLIASALDEINKLKTVGPPQVNIDKFKAEDLRGRETELKTNGFWLGYISNQSMLNEPLSKLDEYDATMSKVTVESLKDAAGKYLSGDNYIRLVLMPEK